MNSIGIGINNIQAFIKAIDTKPPSADFPPSRTSKSSIDSLRAPKKTAAYRCSMEQKISNPMQVKMFGATLNGSAARNEAIHPAQRLSVAEENVLVEWIAKQESLGYAPTAAVVRQVVEAFMKKRGDPYDARRIIIEKNRQLLRLMCGDIYESVTTACLEIDPENSPRDLEQQRQLCLKVVEGLAECRAVLNVAYEELVDQYACNSGFWARWKIQGSSPRSFSCRQICYSLPIAFENG